MSLRFNNPVRIQDLPLSRLSSAESLLLEHYKAAAVKAKLGYSPVLLPKHERQSVLKSSFRSID